MHDTHMSGTSKRRPPSNLTSVYATFNPQPRPTATKSTRNVFGFLQGFQHRSHGGATVSKSQERVLDFDHLALSSDNVHNFNVG